MKIFSHCITPVILLSRFFYFLFFGSFFKCKWNYTFSFGLCTPRCSVDLSDFACPPVPDIPLQQPSSGAPPPHSETGARSNNRANVRSVLPTAVPGNRKRRDDVLFRLRVMGCAELNNQKRTSGEAKNNKRDRNKRGAWNNGALCCRWERLRSRVHPQTENPTGNRCFSPTGCLHTCYATICLFAAHNQCFDNPEWSVFAGLLGISGEMEGLVSEVSIIAEAVKDSAPFWPLV